MRSESYTCDRCGNVADGAVSVYWYSLPVAQAHDLTSVDLCPDCQRELRDWLGGDRDGTVPNQHE